MSIYPYIFVISLFLIVGMIAVRLMYEKFHKHDEHFLHGLLTHRARKIDWKIQNHVSKFKNFIRYFNKKTFSLLIHLVIENVEEYFHKMTSYVKNKFPPHK